MRACRTTIRIPPMMWKWVQRLAKQKGAAAIITTGEGRGVKLLDESAVREAAGARRAPGAGGAGHGGFPRRA